MDRLRMDQNIVTNPFAELTPFSFQIEIHSFSVRDVHTGRTSNSRGVGVWPGLSMLHTRSREPQPLINALFCSG